MSREYVPRRRPSGTTVWQLTFIPFGLIIATVLAIGFCSKRTEEPVALEPRAEVERSLGELEVPPPPKPPGMLTYEEERRPIETLDLAGVIVSDVELWTPEPGTPATLLPEHLWPNYSETFEGFASWCKGPEYEGLDLEAIWETVGVRESAAQRIRLMALRRIVSTYEDRARERDAAGQVAIPLAIELDPIRVWISQAFGGDFWARVDESQAETDEWIERWGHPVSVEEAEENNHLSVKWEICSMISDRCVELNWYIDQVIQNARETPR